MKPIKKAIPWIILLSFTPLIFAGLYALFFDTTNNLIFTDIIGLYIQAFYSFFIVFCFCVMTASVYSPLIFKKNTNFFKAFIGLCIFLVSFAIVSIIFFETTPDTLEYSSNASFLGKLFINIGFMVVYSLSVTFIPIVLGSILLTYTFLRNIDTYNSQQELGKKTNFKKKFLILLLAVPVVSFLIFLSYFVFAYVVGNI